MTFNIRIDMFFTYFSILLNSMTNANITFLGEHPEHIQALASWHQQEWHHISPHLTTDKRVQLYSGYSSSKTIPCCLIATQGDTLLGSASLVLSDMETRTDLTPWLASVFVHPDYRRQGIASRLINHCLDMARSISINRLYLFTPDQKAFYARRGWQLLESCEFNGEQVDIMFYDLN